MQERLEDKQSLDESKQSQQYWMINQISLKISN